MALTPLYSFERIFSMEENERKKQVTFEDCAPAHFWREINPLSSEIFDNQEIILNTGDIFSDTEKTQIQNLRKNILLPYTLHTLAKLNDKTIGWSWGYQDTSNSYYLANSAILPAFRRQGIYTQMLTTTMEKLVSQGFQKIWGRCFATNNEAIIPKLKFGFYLTGFELNDTFGTMAQFSFFPKDLHRNIMKLRTGQRRPDESLRKALNFGS